MKHFLSLTIPLAMFGSAIGWSQDAPKLNARELFYSPPPKPAAGAATAGASGTATTSGTTSATTTTSSGATGSGRSGTASTGTGTVAGGTGKSGGRSGSTKGGNSSGSAATGTSGTTATASTGETASGTAASTNAGTTASTTHGTTAGTTGAGTQAAGTDNGTIVAAVGQADSNVNVNATAPNGPLGLRYAVLKRDTGSTFREVDPETKFRTGDSIRLHVTPSTSGYLYVVQQGASGIWTLLFPRQDVANGSNFVERGQMLAVPNDKAMWTFDAHAGEEKLFIVLARKPEPDLDKLIYSIGGGGATEAGGARLMAQSQVQVRDDVVSHLRQQMLSRDLVFEKVDETTSDSTGVKAENAAYVVSKSTAPDARLVKDLTLSHQ